MRSMGLARALLLAICAAGCYPSVAPRLPQSVAAALAQHPMRSVEGEHLRLYFPQGREVEARRFLTHVELCADYLTRASRIHNHVSDEKMTVLLPELPYNNAFVAPRILGYATEAVVPAFNTLDSFSLEMGLPPDPVAIACHEIAHYVQFQQIAGLALALNGFGAVYTPQIGLDTWFHEGVAVYYETKLRPGVGRLAWPFWRGAFAAGYAGRRISGGDMHWWQRDFHGGNAYLVGSQFVRFLVDRYGEDKLWQLIEAQGRSWIFPLWVNLRFLDVYGQSLSALIDAFADEVQANLRPAGRPANQRVVRPAGTSARYARSPDGTEALITRFHDRPTRLSVYAPDGRLLASRALVDVVPPRRLAVAVPSLVSGLSFTADGKSLYFVSVDSGVTYDVARLLRFDVGTGRLTVVNHDLGGIGGEVSRDGARYLFARVAGDHHDLATLDLRTGDLRVLAVQEHGTYISHPRLSPDGTRIVALQIDGGTFRLVLFEAATGHKLAVLPTGNGPIHDPSWIDDRRILYLGATPATPGFQARVLELDDARGERQAQVTAAPYLAFEARAGGAGTPTVRFLNREGWQWTLDEVPLPAAPEPQPVDPDAPAQSLPLPAEAAPAAPPPSPTAAVNLSAPFADRPYSAFDHLFVPSLFGFTFSALGRDAFMSGFVLSGNDRLSLHRWTAAMYYQESADPTLGGLVGYTNRQLAPLTLSLTAAQYSVRDSWPTNTSAMGRPLLFRRDRLITAEARREFYDNPVSAGFAFVETYRPDDPDVLVTTRRFAGIHVGGAFAGIESTTYTGARRAVIAGVDLTAYPGAWNSLNRDFVDARLSFLGVVPLPVLRRHTFSVGLRARELVGLPSTPPLLQVGGYGSTLLARTANRPEREAMASPLLAPDATFVEVLRGFEDYPFVTDRIGIADLTYRYPLIIDWGTASTLAVLPALFLRQINLELFGAAATDGRRSDPHLAAGAALTFRLALWAISFDLQAQSARRLSDDQGWTQLLTLTL